jgi:hypothetical protein
VEVRNSGADPIVGAEGVVARILGCRNSKVPRFVFLVFPFRIQAHAHVVPALDRPATARPFVVEAGPFVVLFRHFIEHARTDKAVTVAPMPQQVDYGRQGEAGARAFTALVKDVQGIRWIDFAFQLHKRGFVHPVTKIRCISYRRQAELPKFVLRGIGHGDSSLTLVF